MSEYLLCNDFICCAYLKFCLCLNNLENRQNCKVDDVLCVTQSVDTVRVSSVIVRVLLYV